MLLCNVLNRNIKDISNKGVFITGLFDLFKRKNNKNGLTYAVTMNGGTPFTSFGDNIYASDIIMLAIQRKANEFKKLNPRHVKTTSAGKVTITDSSIARVLKRPNAYMTTADFLEKITILLELNKNVFIYPTFYLTKGGERRFTGLYPLKPSYVEYLANQKGEYFINLRFATGYEVTLPKYSVIHWRSRYGVDDYFGGNMCGVDDNIGTLKMLQRYDELTQGIAKALKCSYQINGVMKLNSYLDDETMQAEREKFEKSLKNNESGILFADQKAEYTHIPRDIKIVDAETLKFFYETILRPTGCSLPILNGDYTKEQKEAYYETACEADVISLGQAMTSVIFSDRSETSFGNEIVCYPKAINFMSMENKLAFAGIAAPAGHLLKDELRELFGYEPLPDGQGQVISQGYNNLLDNNNNNLNSTGGANNE